MLRSSGRGGGVSILSPGYEGDMLLLLLLTLLGCHHTAHLATLPTGGSWAPPSVEGFTHEPRHPVGEGEQEAWCRGLDGPMGCLERRQTRGVEWRVLTRTLGGIRYDAGFFPVEGDWGLMVEVNWGDDPGDDDFRMELVRMRGAMVTDRVGLGREISLQVEQTAIRLPVDPTRRARAEFEAILADPVAFQEWSEQRLSALAGAVSASLARGEVERCAYGRYDGYENPRCERVPLTRAEAEPLARVLELDLRRQRELLSAESRTLHGYLGYLLGVGGLRDGVPGPGGVR